MDLLVFGEADDKTLAQIKRCGATAPYAVLCADNHLGYSMPIGGVAAYPDHISPSGVGFDIGCGNKAVRTPIEVKDFDDVGGVMDEITRRISFGMGQPAQEKVDHSVLDDIAHADWGFQRSMVQLASNQLGTVGGGNHYVDLLVDEELFLWVGVHFGSRGFGHKTASAYMKDGPMDAPPVLLDTRTPEGERYVEAMALAGRYAYAGRDVVVDKVLDILGTTATKTIHNHHNFAWRERHFGQDFWVVRKGATPAFPGQQGFVGGSMGDISVILEGVDSEKSKRALYSTVHGAGRVMSRTQARGKIKRAKVYECANRDCDFSVPAKGYIPGVTACPVHGGGTKFRRVVRETVKSKGRIDWDAVRADLTERKIVLRGGDADEAPGAYKHLPEVLSAHDGTIRITHTLRPIGVAMAGPGIRADD